MSVVRLDEEDLDEEDLAILAEVAKKGYYHGRPKTVACAPPERIVAPPPARIDAPSSGNFGRTQFDPFQRKWDRFDSAEFLHDLEERAVGPVAPPAPEPVAAEFKVLLAGDGAVGKTSLVRRHLAGDFDRRWAKTPGVEVHRLTFGTNCGCIRLVVWDLSSSFPHGKSSDCLWGQGDACLGGQGAILMFDLTSRRTYRNVPVWYRDVERACGLIPTVLVGNKADARDRGRGVETKDITFHRRKGFQYYGVSALSGYNVEKPFLWLARRLTNQPGLEFVGPEARAPLSSELAARRAGKALLAEHGRLLRLAQSTAVGGDDAVL